VPPVDSWGVAAHTIPSTAKRSSPSQRSHWLARPSLTPEGGVAPPTRSLLDAPYLFARRALRNWRRVGRDKTPATGSPEQVHALHSQPARREGCPRDARPRKRQRSRSETRRALPSGTSTSPVSSSWPSPDGAGDELQKPLLVAFKAIATIGQPALDHDPVDVRECPVQTFTPRRPISTSHRDTRGSRWQARPARSPGQPANANRYQSCQIPHCCATPPAR
jgi:hypothetical protein